LLAILLGVQRFNMNRQVLRAVSGVLLMQLMSLPLLAQQSPEAVMSVTHYQSEERYTFGLKLLDLALSQLDGAYEIKTASGPAVNEGRGERHLLAGKVDLQWLLTTPEREEKFIPVRVPIYRGI